jgi:ABC-type sugar transport system permease subunit
MSQIKLLLILVFIGTVQDFGGVYLLTSGGPGTSTYVPGLELYFNTTKFGRFGYACALGLVIFVFTMIGTLINMRIKTVSEE